MNTRNYGIDLLRILSMYMVMILHILSHGGVMSAAPFFRTQIQGASLLNSFCIGAVNIFALISGYVGVKSKYRVNKIFGLWGEVVISSWFSIFIALAMRRSITLKQLVISIFPTAFSEYWYFNSYLVLFLFMPLLNSGLISMTKENYKKLMIVLFVLTSIILVPLNWKSFAVNNGYSAIWLGIMYIYGAYFRLHGVPKLAKSQKRLFLVFFCSSLLTYLLTLLLSFAFLELKGDNIIKLSLTRYNWPLTVIESISFFLFFLQLHIKSKGVIKFISCVSPFAFGAYLLQDSTLMRSFLNYRGLADYNVIVMLSLVVVLAIFWLSAGVFINVFIKKFVGKVITLFKNNHF